LLSALDAPYVALAFAKTEVREYNASTFREPMAGADKTKTGPQIQPKFA